MRNCRDFALQFIFLKLVIILEHLSPNNKSEQYFTFPASAALSKGWISDSTTCGEPGCTSQWLEILSICAKPWRASTGRKNLWLSLKWGSSWLCLFWSIFSKCWIFCLRTRIIINHAVLSTNLNMQLSGSLRIWSSNLIIWLHSISNSFTFLLDGPTYDIKL